MKKKNLKSLSLKKSSVSNLNGGVQSSPFPIPLSRKIQECLFTINQTQCTTTWVSELYTACNCEPSWQFGCQQSVDIPCEA